MRISDSQLEAFNFYQILEYTFQRSSFFEKKEFYSALYLYQKQNNELELSRIKYFGIYPFIFHISSEICIFQHLVYFDEKCRY